MVVYSFVVAYTLDYIVRLFEKRLKLPRWLSIILTMVLFAMVLTLIGFLIVPRIVDAAASLIKTVGSMTVDFSNIKPIPFDNVYLNEIQQSFLDSLGPLLQNITDATGDAVLMVVGEIQRITSGIISFFVALIISIYMISEKKDLLARIKRIIYAYFSEERAQRIYYISNLANRIFKDYFVGKLLDSLIIGIIAMIGLSILGFEYALLISVIIAITNMIPYFGPIIGAIPAAIITFVAYPGAPVNVLWMLLFILALQQLDGWVIGPFILSDTIGVSAFWIVIAVTIGGATFGIAGMFLGVPVCVLLKTLLEQDVEKKLYRKGFEGFHSEDIKTRKRKMWRLK